MSFALYVVGFLIIIIGLVVGANMMNIPPRWITVGAVVLVGVGIVSAVTHTRTRDSGS